MLAQPHPASSVSGASLPAATPGSRRPSPAASSLSAGVVQGQLGSPVGRAVSLSGGSHTSLAFLKAFTPMMGKNLTQGESRSGEKNKLWRGGRGPLALGSCCAELSLLAPAGLIWVCHLFLNETWPKPLIAAHLLQFPLLVTGVGCLSKYKLVSAPARGGGLGYTQSQLCSGTSWLD